MRVYVPTTLRELAQLSLGPAPLPAYAVTPALREWYVSDDLEELEYAALVRAAQASLRLLAGDPKAPRRRVVVAADVPDGLVKADRNGEFDHPLALGRVLLTEVLPLARAASVHVDADDAEADVAAAAKAAEAADTGGDDDARFTVDGAEDHELLWYATQEIPALLAE
ncbi:DUF6912 family protein [Phaeacidiphilus oryzae]|uniref:DUF6912 family protein n=1 Tax=Phaeacidiphilus oryzae TaxID=348818 RepID=UPI0005677E62|nr:hypothetical protein [Phaeacidiphilus oryzae]